MSDSIRFPSQKIHFENAQVAPTVLQSTVMTVALPHIQNVAPTLPEERFTVIKTNVLLRKLSEVLEEIKGHTVDTPRGREWLGQTQRAFSRVKAAFTRRVEHTGAYLRSEAAHIQRQISAFKHMLESFIEEGKEKTLYTPKGGELLTKADQLISKLSRLVTKARVPPEFRELLDGMKEGDYLEITFKGKEVKVDGEFKFISDEKEYVLLKGHKSSVDVVLKREMIGEGASGYVHLAESLLSGKVMVIKFPKGGSTASQDAINEMDKLRILSENGEKKGIQGELVAYGTERPIVVGEFYQHGSANNLVQALKVKQFIGDDRDASVDRFEKSIRETERHIRNLSEEKEQVRETLRLIGEILHQWGQPEKHENILNNLKLLGLTRPSVDGLDIQEFENQRTIIIEKQKQLTTMIKEYTDELDKRKGSIFEAVSILTGEPPGAFTAKGRFDFVMFREKLNEAIQEIEYIDIPDFEQRKKLAAQLVKGFKHMQEMGIIHADLKPANIFLNEDEAVIADFGSATSKRVDLSGITRQYVVDSMKDQVNAAKDDQEWFTAAKALDQHAMALSIYELLVGGNLPDEQDRELESTYQKMKQEMVDAGLAGDVAEMLHQMMLPNPTQTVDLKALARGLGG